MMDNSKEGLMYQKKKPSFSSFFDPISEKQEEMSISSIQGNNHNNTKNSNINSKDNIVKNVLDDVDIIRHSQTQKNKSSWMVSSQRNNLDQIKEENINEEVNKSPVNKSYKKKISKKKILKRHSVRGIEKAKSISFNNSEFKNKFIKKSSFGKQVLDFFGNSYFKNKHSLENLR